jgi:hypothetical protein
LRNFAAGTKKKKKAQVHVFDKRSGIHSLERIKEVAAQPGFYDLPHSDSVSADPALTNLENRVAPIIARIVKENSIAQVTANERVAVAGFCSAQMLRVPKWREHSQSINHIAREVVIESGGDPEAAGISELTEDQVRAHGVLWLRHVPEFLPYFLDKDWVLLQARAPASLYISDNPITLFNAKDFGFYGNLGLTCLGIEIYLPLSSRLTLAMLCPSHRAEREAILAKVPSGVKLTPRQQEAVSDSTRFLSAGTSGMPFAISPANVDRLNDLQVRYSARFVYSAEANFDLVRTMLHDHPELNIGLRMQRGRDNHEPT